MDGSDGYTHGYTHGPRAYPTARNRPACLEAQALGGFVATALLGFVLDTRRCQRAYVTISDLAGRVRDGLRAYIRRERV
jgi:hypothetical protein